jgi:hypothetical protein
LCRLVISMTKDVRENQQLPKTEGILRDGKDVRLCMYRMRRFFIFLYVSMVLHFQCYIYGIHKRFCPHSVSRILSMHILAPKPNLFASESIPTKDDRRKDGSKGVVYKDGKLHSQQSPILYQSYEIKRAP